MRIKYTLKFVLFLGLLLGSFSKATAQNNTGGIRGKVVDENNKPVEGVELLLYREDDTESYVDKKTTTSNGAYTFTNVEPGAYIIKTRKISFNDFETKLINVTSNEDTDPKIQLTSKAYSVGGTTIKEKQNSDQKKKLNDDKVATTKTNNDLVKTGGRGFAGLAGLASGVTSTSSGLSGRGSRTDGTAVFIDGVRVFNSGLTQSAGAQVDILQAGIPAQYGDFTGLGISITTKGGVSNRKSGSIELQTSSVFNPYHQNLFEVGYQTPIMFKTNPEYTKGNSSIKKIAIAAMSISGNFYYQKDAPSYIGYQVIKDDRLEEIENRPLVVNKDGGFVHAANYLNENDYNTVKVRPNARAFSSSANAKFDFRLSELATLSFFGNFNYSNSINGGNNIMAYKSNPLSVSTNVLGYVKYNQRFKEPDSAKKVNGTTLNNSYFTVRFDYQSSWGKTQDRDFKDEIFKYGYVGQFKHYPTEFYSYYGNLNNPSGNSRRMVDQNGDTVFLRNFWEQTGFRDTAIRFVQSDINKVRGNYTQIIFDNAESQGGTITNDVQILQNLGLLNGYNPVNIYSLWNSPGTQLAGFNKSQSERYTLYAMGETELKGPIRKDKEDQGHALQFGITYEQTVNRGYGIAAQSLWRQMYQLANSHIAELDRSNPILSYDAEGVFQDTVRYNRLVNYSTQSSFDRAFRKKLIDSKATDIYGKPITETTFLDINSYKPEDFSLDMFSADELLNNGSSLVSYYGYDHLGNKLKKRPGVNDFLQDKEKRSIGAFMPIYTAAWFQDKFKFKDLEFRLGLRLERYDANQLVLKDPYSLYPIKTVGEVKEIDGNAVNHPSNVGSDYAVYVDNVDNPRKILGYRKDNTWYDETGKQLSTPDLIANNTSNGKIAPYLVDPTNKNITENSFKDYQPKVNVLPRVFFKFPLNKSSLFYASYDVLAQRPTAGANFITIDDYFYMTQKATNILANPALTSRITSDYQIGYKQQLSTSTLLSLISYYRETKNDLAAFQFNQAYPVTYISYNNIDFSTVKGFVVELDYKAKNNISINGNYTLQFADGTGSNINSQRALIASNQPNLRSLFPLGDLDIRHQIKGIFNWEFFDSKNKKDKRYYSGPIIGKTMILKNVNFNVTFAATSGLPYTATSQPVQQGSADRAPIKGTPWGSRLPWQLTSTLNVQKNFPIKWNDKETGKSKGAYFQVYVYTTNLFNRRNVNGVWPYTGSPESDGFLNSPKGQQALRTQLDAAAYQYYYNTAVNNPGNYQAPRFMRLGARMYF